MMEQFSDSNDVNKKKLMMMGFQTGNYNHGATESRNVESVMRKGDLMVFSSSTNAKRIETNCNESSAYKFVIFHPLMHQELTLDDN